MRSGPEVRPCLTRPVVVVPVVGLVGRRAGQEGRRRGEDGRRRVRWTRLGTLGLGEVPVVPSRRLGGATRGTRGVSSSTTISNRQLPTSPFPTDRP